MVFPSFQKGQPARAADLNTIVDLIKRVRVLPSSGLRVTETTQGTALAVVPTRRGGSSSPDEHPFQLFTVVDPETEEIQIRIRYGTIDGVAPTGMSLGDDPPYLLTPDTESGVIYAVVTWDPEVGAPLLSRDLGQAEELPEDEEGTAHVEIGSWTTDESDNIILAQAITNSIDVVICRNWFAVEGPYWNVTFLT
jgi:hypothetical protein